ncbi:MAG: NTP transferase domain-containing protein [Muribaculaceae bacterium]|nr:NTP transferase domain-containing protein [Muribaculaceae bacterium]
MSNIQPNAIILAAGTASRFVPLSEEIPKGLIEVKGEPLIERQINQLHQAGITDITVVVGYMAEKFSYLKKKYGVDLVLNEDYEKYNNTSSMIRVLDRLNDSYILTSDNYYPENIFLNDDLSDSYYSALFAKGDTGEYCLDFEKKGYITDIRVGGKDSWYMYGPVFFSSSFSKKFSEFLSAEYDSPEVKTGYWEDLYIKHISSLPMKIRKRDPEEMKEFDSLDELREFDHSYIQNTRSSILASIARQLNCKQSDLCGFKNKRPVDGIYFEFTACGSPYEYKDGIISNIQ